MRAPLLLTLLFSFAAQAENPAPAADPKAAKQLNSDGYKLYQEKKFPEALEKFRAAAQADPKLAIAHYNLGATLGVLRKAGKTCEFDAFRSAITTALGKAVALDPKRKTRVKKDPDYDVVRDTLAYQKLMGADLKSQLENVSWWGPGRGVFGSTSGLDLQPNGVAEYWFQTYDEMVKRPLKKVERGTWKLKGETVILDIPNEDRRPTHLEGGMKGTLLWFNDEMSFQDSNLECDA